MLNQPRITIGLSHPNSRNAEAFLNSWEEPFLLQEKGTNKFIFHSAISQTKLELIFFDSYDEANSFGIEHLNPVNETSMWNLNGSMLFSASGNNADKVQSLVSHFAGKE
ncbi:hypothetical protein A4H97_28250 [Niastella yeongjuensis]|uniref:Uncharacterized protein n=1 Tax=Niastella yeongjuensis TaxID=354355 RepID=A0A1V9EV54_9BACT|nr:hypothetical protein [Niastella yeongjuensis]OQP49784.1 hypothetical protein A4H97_28250 [Niastella yeongjuensis]SEP40348.1 hypothetical protein SAMN05660816_05783 [Niastella yeongjuensis]